MCVHSASAAASRQASQAQLVQVEIRNRNDSTFTRIGFFLSSRSVYADEMPNYYYRLATSLCLYAYMSFLLHVLINVTFRL